MFRLWFLPLCLIVSLSSCGDDSSQEDQAKEIQRRELSEEQVKLARYKRPSAMAQGKVIEKEGRTFLYGGPRPDMHFEITGADLELENLHFGVGRQLFPPLFDPAFTDADQSHFEDTTQVIVVISGQQAKTYGLTELSSYRVVNDEIGGEPIAVMYSVLADIPHVFSRKVGDSTFTFAHSGYTYFEDNVETGMDGFLIWDQQTESLWWPLSTKAVSGAMQGSTLQESENIQFKRMRWSEVVKLYPQTAVLSPRY